MEESTTATNAPFAVEQPHLVPPVQLTVQCTSCGYERTNLALHQRALDEALRCERCKAPNRVLGHRSQSACACCL